MRRRTVLASALFGLPALALAADPKENSLLPPPAKLSLAIAIPEHHGKRSLNEYDRFHVLVGNEGKSSVHLWTDRFSWGYDNLSFEIIQGDGQIIKVAKKPRGWTKNYPDWLALAPGEHYVLSVDFFSEQGREIWENAPPKPVGKSQPAMRKMRAVYSVLPDQESQQHNVWTGRIESPAAMYVVW